MASLPSLAVPSPQGMIGLGERIGRRLFEGAVIGLSGPLGAGKTTLVRGIAAGMGIDEGYIVSSPTYTVLQVYPCGRKELFHLDLYRVQGPEDLDSTGYREGMGKGRVLVIEWVEKIPSALPPEHLGIIIEYDEGGRLVRFLPQGEKYMTLALGLFRDLGTTVDTGKGGC